MDYRITNELGSTRTDEIVSHLARPRLWIPGEDYPDFSVWTERAHSQLKADQKRAMVAVDHGNVVGLVLYQKHKELPDTLEIKNVSVRPEASGRYLASVLLRNAELEGAREFNVRHVVCDAKASNTGIRLFLLRHRYLVQAEFDLYGLGAGRDLIFKKTLV